MTWRMSGALGAALAAVLLSCGPSEDEAMKVREGSNLDDIVECPGLYCGFDGQGQSLLCAELLMEYGRSPPLCVDTRICERMECLKQGRRCVLFDGIPVQVRCIKDDD
ncbi:hypothetical protein POL68_19115 [Stigmatella sp. ncwal1]|uniref:Lipoprotein n=1 Tax=Stigmatella ashevillensis TaxID=2995309 RepID=A0ABT5DE60_9BACT|nr:hypothetical protein [Stigmatella ashevillena]MDC0710596.1 hypothetical protein [Stigmatella ashevillena]